MTLTLVSPERIREWSHGAVEIPDTIDYETRLPVPTGLFCPKIFGPGGLDRASSWIKTPIEQARSPLLWAMGLQVDGYEPAAERFGHLDLATPVCHPLFVGWRGQGQPTNLLGRVLGLASSSIVAVVYCRRYIVLEPGKSPHARGKLLSPKEYFEARRESEDLLADTGGSAIRRLLDTIELASLEERLSREPRSGRYLEAVRWFRRSLSLPSWAVLQSLPVLPPAARPMWEGPDGKYRTSDLNALYREVIYRNHRLRRMLELGAPEMVLCEEKSTLQKAVDSLFANGRRYPPMVDPANRSLSCVLDWLEGARPRSFSLAPR